MSNSNIPHRGDHIRVLRPLGYYHHGIFVSNDEVIHFTSTDDDSILDWSKARVMQTTLQQFLRGGELEIVKHDPAKLYPVDDIVEYARDCVGDTGYNLLFENCEHFANECAIGEHRSKQVDGFLGAAKTAVNFIGGRAMGLFGTIASTALDFLGSIFGSSSSGGRKPSKTEKVKLEEVERDRQIKLAEIERDKSLSLADKEIARAKIERETQTRLKKLEIERIKAEQDYQIELLREQTRAHMAEAEQRAKLSAMEHEMQLRLIDKENERVNLVRDAQINLIQVQTASQIAIEKARTEGFEARVKQLVILQEKMLEIAEKRIAIIEKGSLPIIREIESFYNEIGEKIQADSDEYNTKKLPQLLMILGQYAIDSPEHKIYSAQILADMKRHGKFIEQQMARVSDRQNLVLQSFLSSKDNIIAQTGQITQQIAEIYLKRFENLLPQGQATLQALPNVEIKQLPPAK